MTDAEYVASLAVDVLTASHMTMWDLLRRARDRAPTSPAVVSGHQTTTYEGLVQTALACASRLVERGVRKGTRVAYAFHTCPEWVVLHYALARLGAVGVPLNLALESRELGHSLRAAGAEVVIAIRRFGPLDFERKLEAIDPGRASTAEASIARIAPQLRWVELLDVDDEGIVVHDRAYRDAFEPQGSWLHERSTVGADEEAYLLFTSGSTASPKAVMCPHRSFLGAAQGWVHALDLGPDDRFLNMLPTFHTGGITCGLIAPHSAGAATHLMGAFTPEKAIRMLETDRCTVTVGFDTMMTKIMGSPAFDRTRVASLRKLALGCTPSYYEHLQQTWGFDLVVLTYGSTESGSLAAIVPANEHDESKRKDSNGRPLPGLDVRIIDPETGQIQPTGAPGEICFRGWARFHRYDGMPTETTEAIDGQGYFHSGDYGWLDDAGFLYFRGRYKMMIKTGGENVSEREVEIFLEDHLPEVDFAQVVGAPHDVWGEMVVAFVQLAPSVPDTLDPDRLRSACRGHIAGFKIPKVIHYLDATDWPQLANGRPDKQALRDLARTWSSSPTPQTLAGADRRNHP